MAKHLSITDLRDTGVLHEANRLFFHPLGLALELTLAENSEAPAELRIQDWREDPEGVIFDESILSAEKAEKFGTQQKKKHLARQAILGYVIQPVTDELNLTIDPEENNRQVPIVNFQDSSKLS